jgi:hypothetical protein
LKDQAHVPEPEAASPKDPPPNETPPRLVTGTARFDRCIDDQINARPGYHAGMVVATVAGRGKGSEGRTMRGDVALAYNAGARDKPNRVLANVTAAELRRYYRDGWGVLDDDRQGRGLFSILLHTIANTGGNVTGKMTAAWREFAPWLPVTDMAKLADDAINVRRRWRSATLGQRIGLTYADRTRLRITTAWACDKPKADQGRLTKQRRRGQDDEASGDGHHPARSIRDERLEPDEALGSRRHLSSDMGAEAGECRPTGPVASPTEA